MSKTTCYMFVVGLFLLFRATDIVAQIDSSYIRVYDQPLSIKAFADYKFMALEHEYGKTEDSFHSNNPLSVGLALGWKKVSVSGSISIAPLRNKRRGKTESFDFQHRYYGQKFVTDVWIQQYKGFYQKDDERDKVVAICPDIKVIRYGASGQYIFNNKKFSYSAAFNNNVRQKTSAGSFHVGANIYYTRIQSDSSIVYNDNYKQTNLQIGINGGYAYTWALKRYYITGSATIGMNVGTDNISEFYNRKVGVYPSALSRLAAGYYGKDWTIGLSGVIHMNNLFIKKENRLNLTSGSLQLMVTKRINFNSKFLDKITFQ